MPIYNYKCSNCLETIDILQKINDNPIKTCSKCNCDTMQKQLTTCVFGFKGTGYYCTDFKNK